MPWTDFDQLNYRATDRPETVTATSLDGSHTVRVMVSPMGNAVEAIRAAQDSAQRILEEQYPMQRIDYDWVDVTSFGARYWMTLPVSVRRIMTEEEVAAQEAERERLVQAHAEACRLQRLASEKAEATFRRMLSPEQLASCDEHGHFMVTGSEGHIFRIGVRDYSGNIKWVGKDGSVKGKYCCHPIMSGTDLAGARGGIPLHDALISQKLMLETDEIGFMRTTVVNSGDVPKSAKQHVTGQLPRHQRCRCEDCRYTSSWAF